VAGVAGGYVTGSAAAFFAAQAVHYHIDSQDIAFQALGFASGAVGAVLGGLGAHALAASPHARAPAVAIALAPVYVITFESTFE
jgi:hypothetical protein